MSPQRIQRRRVGGWRMPEGAIYVGRGSKWGNPFALRTRSGLVRAPGVLTGEPWEYEDRISAHGMRHDYHHSGGRVDVVHVRYGTAAEVVELYEAALARKTMLGLGRWEYMKPTVEDVRRELAGKDLACWCPLTSPCHADVLLKWANGSPLSAPELKDPVTAMPIAEDARP